MSDFLTRLAGRALRQTPVLEPLVASVHEPLEAGKMLAPDFEVADEGERRAPGQRALDRRSPMGVVRRPEARDVGVAAATALPGDPVLRTGATARTPTERVVDTVVDVESAAAQPVVDVKEPMVAAPGAVLVNRGSASSEEDYPRTEHHTRTEDYQRGALITPSDVLLAEVGGAPRNQVLALGTTVLEEVGGPVEHTLEDHVPKLRNPSPRPARRAEGAVAERSIIERTRDELTPGAVARPRHELSVRALESPTITVSIGRIEVRAAPAEPHIPARAAAPRPGPRLSLDEYLAQRNRSQQ